MCKNSDLFDINGVNKLTEECISEREAIIMHHAKNPKSIAYISHSSGKDSQACYELVMKLFPKERIVVIHAALGTVEHNGVIEHINDTIEHPLEVVRNERKDFIGMVLLRKMFPSPKYRQCTSDLKTSPIYKFIRAHMTENGYTHGFNVTGLRAEESAKRAMKNPLWINKDLTLTSGKRTVFDWMPIFHYSEQDVYQAIKESGKNPHPAYGNRHEGGRDGNDRLSCVFCIMSSALDLSRGAAKYVDHYHEMVALERVVDHTMYGRTKTIHTDRAYSKGDALGEGTVVTSEKNTSKRAIMPYKNVIFIKVPLDEKIGAPIDELLVQRHMKRLKALQVELELVVEKEKQEKAEKKRKAACVIGSKNKNRDTTTIDFIEMMGAVI